MKTYCIILASGFGTRFGGDVPKQFLYIGDRMLFEYTLDKCIQASVVDELILVVSEEWLDVAQEKVSRLGCEKRIRVVIGGASRRESCEHGLRAISDIDAKVLIHNSVQPFITARTMEKCVRALDEYDAVTVGSPCVYTILELNQDREIARVVPRNYSVNDLGPECFNLSFIRHVLETTADDKEFTNLTGFILKNDFGKVYVVDGEASNVKITYRSDFELASEKLLAENCH